MAQTIQTPPRDLAAMKGDQMLKPVVFRPNAEAPIAHARPFSLFSSHPNSGMLSFADRLAGFLKRPAALLTAPNRVAGRTASQDLSLPGEN